MITAGIDCGAKNTKTIILKDGKISGKGIFLTGFDQSLAIKKSFENALKCARIHAKDIDVMGGTGADMEAIKKVDIKVNQIKAMARAANYFFPSSRTVIDVGAETAKAVKINKTGKVIDFATNEKCAAGTGVFLEAMSRALEVKLEDIGPMGLRSKECFTITAQCVVFAETEVVGLIHAKIDKIDISKAIHDAMASKVVSMIRRIGVDEDVVLIGGVGLNPGFVASLKTQLEVDNIYIPKEPSFGGAVGAAILAGEEV